MRVPMTEMEEGVSDRSVRLQAEGIDPDRVPQHVAIIMDGNGRWAHLRGKERVHGHLHGVESVRAAVETALETGVRYLTLYAFSTENWNRPQEEVDALMDLLVDTLVREVDDLAGKGVRLRTIGDLAALPERCRMQLREAESRTQHLQGLDLVLALSYSGKWELVEAIRALVREGVRPEDIDASAVDSHLSTAGIPDPELMIRTSGEHRISNFLLWQLAYAEFHFTPVLWPDFRKEHFQDAIRDFQHRERRFGGLLDTNHSSAPHP